MRRRGRGKGQRKVESARFTALPSRRHEGEEVTILGVRYVMKRGSLRRVTPKRGRET